MYKRQVLNEEVLGAQGYHRPGGTQTENKEDALVFDSKEKATAVLKQENGEIMAAAGGVTKVLLGDLYSLEAVEEKEQVPE